ncbi:1071_t:CDS:1, partial [Ambispora gerdemannii]
MKNIVLIIIVIFINFAFVTASLNWERDELDELPDLRNRYVNKIYTRNSSLEARAKSSRRCETAGYYLCPDKSGCCPNGEECIKDGSSYVCNGNCTVSSVDCGDGYCCKAGQVCVGYGSSGYCKTQKKSSGSTISPA